MCSSKIPKLKFVFPKEGWKNIWSTSIRNEVYWFSFPSASLMSGKTVASRILEEEDITTTLPNFLVRISYLNAAWQRSTWLLKGGKSYTAHFKDADWLFAYLTCPKLPLCPFQVFCTPARLNNYLVASIISQEFWVCIHSHLHLQVSPPCPHTQI